jgi:asparagine synthase (glutamine-hydrolysing)
LQRVQQWETMNREEVMLDLVDIYQHDQLVNTHLLPFDHGPMAHALECRVPYLDYEVVQYIQTIPEHLRIWKQSSKIILRLLLADALAKTPELARLILTRRPTPAIFSTRGCQNWLNRFLEEKFSYRPLERLDIGKYSRNLPDLFWLGSIRNIFLSHRGQINGMTFEELANEVLGDALQ